MAQTNEEHLADMICEFLTFAYANQKYRKSLRSRAAEDFACSLEQYLAMSMTQMISERFTLVPKQNAN